MTFTTPIHTNEQSVERVLGAGLPVLLVFWRGDCQPCAQLNPTLDRLAERYAGKLLIAKIQVDDNRSLGQRFNVTQLPALRFVKDGHVTAEATGAAAEPSLQAWLGAALGGRPVPPISGPSAPLQGGPRPQPRQNASQPTPRQASSAPSANGTSTPVVLTDVSFDQIVGQTQQPVLVDFWAPWCGPCRMVAPAVEQLAREFAGRAIVAKLNIDDHQRVAQRYGIMSIPTLYVFKGGKIVERLVGAQPVPALRQALQRHIA